MTNGSIRKESIRLLGSLVSDFRLTHLGIHNSEQAHNRVFPLAARRSWSVRFIPEDSTTPADPWLCAPPSQTVCPCLGSKADRNELSRMDEPIRTGSGPNTDPLTSTETYDTMRDSQKSLVNETLRISIVRRLNCLFRL